MLREIISSPPANTNAMHFDTNSSSHAFIFCSIFIRLGLLNPEFSTFKHSCSMHLFSFVYNTPYFIGCFMLLSTVLRCIHSLFVTQYTLPINYFFQSTQPVYQRSGVLALSSLVRCW